MIAEKNGIRRVECDQCRKWKRTSNRSRPSLTLECMDEAYSADDWKCAILFGAQADFCGIQCAHDYLINYEIHGNKWFNDEKASEILVRLGYGPIADMMP